MFKKIILLICTFLLLSTVGCSKDSSEDVNTKKLGIRGQVTKVSSDDSGKIKGILVEGIVEQDTEYDKASVYIGENTKIYKNNTKEELKRSVLKEGIKVEVIFEGGVRESYPVQADAKVIRVIE
jgi:beta-N-acetylhexosaminidase